MSRAARLGLPVSLGMLLVAILVIAVSAAEDVRGRSTGPEAVVRRYFAALQQSDVDAALDQIAPAARALDAGFVENGAGNEYRVVGTAVRTPSIIDRLQGAPSSPQDVTIFLDVTEAVSGDQWQATPRVPLVEQGGRWYLARAPLAAP